MLNGARLGSRLAWMDYTRGLSASVQFPRPFTDSFLLRTDRDVGLRENANESAVLVNVGSRPS